MCFFVFFFQAEDGIRDLIVTGVQTCALPIWSINIIITKKISKDDSAITILAYQSIFMSLLSF